MMLGFLFAAAAATVAPAQEATPSLSKELLIGTYRVTELRTATDTPSTLAHQAAAERYRSTVASFGKAARWRDGISCRSWELSQKLGELPLDPSLAELRSAKEPLGWAELTCDGREIDQLFVIDRWQMLSRTPNGATWLVWRRIDPTRRRCGAGKRGCLPG